MASSPREIEERTSRMRTRTRSSKTEYVIKADITHAGLTGTVTGGKTENCEVTVSLFGQTAKLREDQIQEAIDFLSYAREECKVLREKYDAIEDPR